MRKEKVSIETLEAANEALAEAVAEAQEKIQTLEAKTDSILIGETPADPVQEAQPFKIGGTTYRFTIKRFIVDGEVLNAHEVCAKPELRERIALSYPGLVETLKD